MTFQLQAPLTWNARVGVWPAVAVLLAFSFATSVTVAGLYHVTDPAEVLLLLAGPVPIWMKATTGGPNTVESALVLFPFTAFISAPAVVALVVRRPIPLMYGGIHWSLATLATYHVFYV